jgi:hypothetical protein
MAERKDFEKNALRLHAALETLAGAVDTEYAVYGISNQLRAALENAEKTLEEIHNG